MYILTTMDFVYLFMLWVVLQVLMFAFDLEGDIHIVCKIIFPIAIVTGVILLLMGPYFMFGR